jgi:hypothetical protein
LEEKIKEDKASKKRDHGQTQQAEEDTNRFFGAPVENKEEQVGEALKTWVKWT